MCSHILNAAKICALFIRLLFIEHSWRSKPNTERVQKKQKEKGKRPRQIYHFNEHRFMWNKLSVCLYSGFRIISDLMLHRRSDSLVVAVVAFSPSIEYANILKWRSSTPKNRWHEFHLNRLDFVQRLCNSKSKIKKQKKKKNVFVPLFKRPSIQTRHTQLKKSFAFNL